MVSIYSCSIDFLRLLTMLTILQLVSHIHKCCWLPHQIFHSGYVSHSGHILLSGRILCSGHHLLAHLLYNVFFVVCCRYVVHSTPLFMGCFDDCVVCMQQFFKLFDPVFFIDVLSIV